MLKIHWPGFSPRGPAETRSEGGTVRILITGASGFLGSWFLNHFIKADEPNEIWYMDIQPHPAGLPVDQIDMVDYLKDFDEDVDLVFHFAAPVGGRMKIEHDPMYNA